MIVAEVTVVDQGPVLDVFLFLDLALITPSFIALLLEPEVLGGCVSLLVVLRVAVILYCAVLYYTVLL